MRDDPKGDQAAGEDMTMITMMCYFWLPGQCIRRTMGEDDERGQPMKHINKNNIEVPHGPFTSLFGFLWFFNPRALFQSLRPTSRTLIVRDLLWQKNGDENTVPTGSRLVELHSDMRWLL